MLTRPPTQFKARPEGGLTSTVLSFHPVLYGYSAAIIAQWCLVSLRHAHRLKSGRARPTPRILKLFQLHACQQVLGPQWSGWQVVGDRLFNPANESFTRAQLEAYVLIWQLASSRAPESVHKVLAQLQGAA